MTNKFTVTLADLRKAGACFEGYNKVVRALQGKSFTPKDEARESYIHFTHEEPIPVLTILESNGFEDALWVLKCVEGIDRDLRLYAVWCARQVQPLMKDERSINALDAAWDAAWDAARDAASNAAWDAAWDADCNSTSNAAWDAAWDATRATQKAKLAQMLEAGEFVGSTRD